MHANELINAGPGELAVTGASGMEHVRTPLLHAHLVPEHGHGSAYFRTQVPIARFPRELPNEAAPGISAVVPDTDPRQKAALWQSPQRSRKIHWATLFERVRDRLLTGSATGERGELIESRPQTPILATVGDHDANFNNPAGADGTGISPQRIVHRSEDGQEDDISKLIQSSRSFPHDALRAFHANFPYVQVSPLPFHTVTIPLVQNVAGEIIFPDISVVVRITQTSINAADIWYSRQGAARIPQATDLGSGNFAALTEGMILNLGNDPAYHLAKNVRGLSAICSQAAFVNVACYKQT